MTPIPHDQIPELALQWHRAGRGAVLATVIDTWGSAPRATGSQMVVDGAGVMMGSVSGGCVEGAVMTEAAEALATGVPRVLTFGVSDDDAFSVGLACGGTIRVLVEPVGAGLPEAMLAELVAGRAATKAVALTTDLASFDHALLALGQDAAVDARLRSDKSGVEGARFIAVHNPPLRLIVVGAVHIAQSLVPLARACGYAPTLIDPRSAFGGASRFPGEAIIEDWPDAALAALVPDARTAIVTLAHDPKLDDPAVAFALRSKVFYLGCLGSTRTHAKRLERLAAAGFAPDTLARIHAPVGLHIGAKSPAEIAVSIMAEIIQVLRQG
ncbi:MAG: XdhC family protein [Paracoccaceae bacterium]